VFWPTVYVCMYVVCMHSFCSIVTNMRYLFKIYLFCFITGQAFVLLAALYINCTVYLKFSNTALLVARSHLL